jgi:KDO2-lipid IV(A) lauroyltransferase
MAVGSGRWQELQWRLEAAGYDLVAAAMRLVPIDAASAFGGWLLRALGPLTPTHKTALRNLRLAFPDWDEAERGRIARLQWENVGRVFAEFFLMDRILADPSRVEYPSEAEVEGILGDPRPLIFVSGHFANFEVMASSGLRRGVEGVLVYRGLNNPYIDQRMRRSRLRYGVKLLAPKGREGGRDVMAALNAGVPVGILADQKYNEGPLVPFFGHDARTQPAPVRWALRFGARLQPGWVERTRGARFKLFPAPPIELPAAATPADVVEGLRQINAFIEARARARPWEYWWVHRRFPDAVYARLAAEER